MPLFKRKAGGDDAGDPANRDPDDPQSAFPPDAGRSAEEQSGMADDAARQQVAPIDGGDSRGWDDSGHGSGAETGGEHGFGEQHAPPPPPQWGDSGGQQWAGHEQQPQFGGAQSAWGAEQQGGGWPAPPSQPVSQPAAAQSPHAGPPAGSVMVTDEPRRPPEDGDEFQWHTYHVTPTGKPDAVEFIEVHKAFGRNKILRGLNMGLPEGMISMILGPSGTGKSVCIKHMVGLLYPDEGDVLVHGESIPNMEDDRLFEVRKKFGVLFQDGALFGSMNLLDNVAFPLRQHTDKSEEEILSIVRRRLNEVGLGHSEDKMPNELSGGMRKRAGFARALVLDPDIVLFDEPDSGLDPVRTALLGELIQEIHADVMEEAEQAGKEHLPCFSVITHDIMSARRVADYICVLWKGRIVEAGPKEQMLNSDNQFIRQFLTGESQGPLAMD